MAEPLKISTSKYAKSGKAEVDGQIWDVVLPGAGTEMRFSQASRACTLADARMEMIKKKIVDGTVTEAELDSYEEYSKKYDDNERVIYDIFFEVFKDGTKDNSQVKKWMDETPTAFIMMAFEEVQAKESNDTAATPETS